MKYSDLSERAQVLALRRVATRMLTQYDVQVGTLRLLQHGFNTTFRVDAVDGRRFALRINTNSERTPGEMNAEAAWVQALGRETSPRVPSPQPTTAGALVCREASEELGREVRGILYSWLSGPLAHKYVGHAVVKALGALTRELHRHADGYTLPPGCELFPMKDPLFGHSYVVDSYVPELDHGLMLEVFGRSCKVLERLKQGRQVPIHFDLHFYNLKWRGGELSAFDFDDCILGMPVFDAYITVFYLRNYAEWRELETLYMNALEQTLDDFEVTKAEFELLVASRGLTLANELLRWDHAHQRDMGIRYAKATNERMRHYSRTGTFDPLVSRFTDW
jgi:Ser/Thr protein kinase RdoA (MazF antagonist)